jgi:hypothetical protein
MHNQRVQEAPEACPYAQPGVQEAPEACPYAQPGVQEAPEACPYAQPGVQEAPEAVPFRRAATPASFQRFDAFANGANVCRGTTLLFSNPLSNPGTCSVTFFEIERRID